MKLISLIVATILFTVFVFGQTALGPATGSVPSGAVVSTDSFEPEGASSYPGPLAKQERNKFPIPVLPTPANVTPPSGPEGSNYIEWRPEATEGITGIPITIASFEGMPQSIAAGIPPDPYIAVGPNHVVTVINSSFRIFDKSGNIIKTIGADSWFNSVLLNSGAFDPKVLYDHFDNRWIMVWLSQNDNAQTGYFLLSVSDDSDPTGTWYNWALPSNVNGSTVAGNWGDYEGVGFDGNAIYFATNQFQFSGSYDYSKIRIIGKAQLYANTAGSVTWNDLWDIRDQLGFGVSGIRPGIIHGSPGTYYLIGWPNFSTGTYVVLYRLTNPLTTPAVTATNISVVAFSQAPNANQLGGSSTLIDAGGSRPRNEPVYRDNSLWVVHSVGSGPGNSYSSLRYLRINTQTNAATEDISYGLAGFWFFYPAIAVDKDKNVMITFTLSGETQYAGAFFTWRLSTDAPGLQPIETMREGAGNYVRLGNSRNRWGDYNGIAIDPADQNNFWMFGEYAAATNTFSTWVHAARVVPYSGARIVSSLQSKDFGPLEVGTSSDTIEIRFENTGSDTLTISSISKNTQAYSLVNLPPLPARLATFESVALRVFFRPAAHGAVNDSITIGSNDAVNPLTRIPLSGRGVEIGRAQPGVMYASSGTSNGRLYTIDVTTGTPTDVGSLNISEIHSLAIRPDTKELYGTRTNPSATELFRISSIHGEVLAHSVIPVANMRAIAFGGGDTLYSGTTTGQLYRTLLGSGTTSLVGNSSPAIVYSGLSFNPITGVLWASVRSPLVNRDKIFTVNTATGAGTEIGATGFNVITPGIAFDPAGNLFGITGLGPQVNNFILIDQSTGTGTLIGSTGLTGLNGIAVRPDTVATVVEQESGQHTPTSFVLLQNYPNPFNPTTQIRYGLPAASRVRLAIYNLVGQRIMMLVDGVQEPGFYAVEWNGRDASGKPAASGVYLYRLEATILDGAPGRDVSFTDARKLLLLK